MSKTPQVVRVERAPDDTLVLHDPTALAMVGGIACSALFDANRDRVEHFARRIVERGDDPQAVAIVLLDVDDAAGSMLADVLMPGHDWQSYRDRGEKPVARGLAGREGIVGFAETLTEGVVEVAAQVPRHEALVVVVTEGVAQVFGVPLSTRGAR